MFDALLTAAFNQYVIDKCDDYPSKEELDKMYPKPKRGLKRLKRELRRRKRLSKKSPLRTFGIISLIALSILSVCALLLLVPPVRHSVAGFTEDLLGIDIVLNSGRRNDKTPPSNNVTNERELIYDYEIGYIPDGYTQRENSVSQNRGYYSYFDEDGRYIYVSISPAYMTSVSLDGDSFEHDALEIMGRRGHLAYNEDIGYGTLIITDGDFIIQIDAITEKQELLRIAEGILDPSPENSSENAPPLSLY